MVKSLDIQVFFEGEENYISKREIFGAVSRIKEVYQGKELTIEVIFDYSESLVQNLNKSYRKKNAETDVLSFGIESNFGQIFISISYLEKNGLKSDRLEELLKHGILHILGYDHQTDKEFEEMESASEKIFSS